MANPYPGPRPFRKEEYAIFSGREHEISELASLIVSHQVVLLYAQSGAGKTSLVNAGLAHSLEEQGVRFLPVARVGIPVPQVPLAEISNVYSFSMVCDILGEIAITDPWYRKASLVEAFGKLAPAVDARKESVLSVCALDQFEELFTAYPERWPDRERFFLEIAALLEARRDLRILFVLREDYLAGFSQFAQLLPERGRTRYRIERLRQNEAISAICKPLEGTRRSYAPRVAETIAEDLSNITVVSADGKPVAVPGEFVEPVQLQVVCYTLFERLPEAFATVTLEAYRKYGDPDDALEGFYQQALDAAVEETRVDEGELREWFERRLITPAGTRGLVFRDQESTGDIPNRVVSVLEQRHIIRPEIRSGSHWYELSHDRFIRPIQRANLAWRSARWSLEARSTERIQAVVHKTGVAEGDLRNFLDSLTSADGRRNPRPAGGVPQDALVELVTAGLLRQETVDGVEHYSLAGVWSQAATMRAFESRARRWAALAADRESVLLTRSELREASDIRSDARISGIPVSGQFTEFFEASFSHRQAVSHKCIAGMGAVFTLIGLLSLLPPLETHSRFLLLYGIGGLGAVTATYLAKDKDFTLMGLVAEGLLLAAAAGIACYVASTTTTSVIFGVIVAFIVGFIGAPCLLLVVAGEGGEGGEKIAPEKRADTLQWSKVFQEELQQINLRRGARPEDASNLAGLAISGGGIRSATFALGVLEALKKYGLLAEIDYLSTVSGGGFIGAWLSANCKRAQDARETAWLQRERRWEESIGHLRRYSKYLAPEVGFFSADTWSMATVWLRNALVVQVTIVFAMAVALMVPRPLHDLFIAWPESGHWRWTTVALFIAAIAGVVGNQRRVSSEGEVSFQRARNWAQGLACAAVLLLVAWQIGMHTGFDPFVNKEVNSVAAFAIALLMVLAGYCLLPVGARIVGREINYTQPWAQGMIVMPMMVTGLLVAAILWGQSSSAVAPWKDLDGYGEYLKTEWRYWPFPLWIALASLWVLSFCSIPRWKNNWKGLFIAFIAPLPAMLVLYLLLCAIMLLLHAWAADDFEGRWMAFIWAPSLVLYAFSLSVVTLIGIMGRETTESVREWWSRLGAWLAIYGAAWMVITIAGVYGPLWAAYLMNADWWAILSTAAGWLGATLTGLLAGNSGATGSGSGAGEPRRSMFDRIKEVAAAVGPFVFIAGMLIGVSTALHLTILSLTPETGNWASELLDVKHWDYLSTSSPEAAWMVLAASLAGLLLFAWRVDINEFSLNEFYRTRLSRCYLGATRRLEARKPQNFTGFDEKDDMPLAELVTPGKAPAGPLHIINCALNLGGAGDLSVHTRHCASFTLTPYATGSTYESGMPPTPMGYRRTGDYQSLRGHPTLAQAVSVSGAAASPNMGYHTSPVVAFFLTVFNLRLGWWFPSPRKPGRSPAPAFSLRYLFMELFGIADDQSNFLMISDGGHFENLAAYQLIRRKCRIVIISDGECDPKLQFEGLGTLIRMVEVDFGTRILIDVESIRPDPGAAWSANRCAVGRIRYDPADPASDGVLIYLKASMTGHEGPAILQYKSAHPAFPHEPTGNQFYGEDQFESYRHLGREIAERTFAPVATQPEHETAIAADSEWLRIGDQLLRYFEPPLTGVGRFTEHTDNLMRLWQQLDAHPELRLFSEAVENELNVLGPEHASFRSAFLICSQMLQLMENVYLDLDLENTWQHPDNRGWRNTFQRWWESPAMQKTWELNRSTYGLRFQYFCDRHFRRESD